MRKERILIEYLLVCDIKHPHPPAPLELTSNGETECSNDLSSIEYVIKEYVFMSFWLNAIYTLYVILYLYMYEKATRYQWFEEKSLSLQQNQLS